MFVSEYHVGVSFVHFKGVINVGLFFVEGNIF